MLGKIINKKLDGRAIRGIIETEHPIDKKAVTTHNFVVYRGPQMAAFDQIKPEDTVYIEGRILKSPYNHQEIEIRHFEVPNK